MLEAIKHGLGNLLNPNGRDARQAFWYYVLFIYLVVTAISAAVVMPLTMESMIGTIQASIASGQGQDPAAAQAAAQAAAMASMGKMFPAMVWIGVAGGAIMLAGLAASLARRLHDSGLSGRWALLPAACQLAGIAALPVQMAKMQQQVQSVDPNNPLAGLTMVSGSVGIGQVLGWVAIGLVIYFGVRKSDEEPNQYGDAPFVA